MSKQNHVKKVTITVSDELKEKLLTLKRKKNISLSSIFKEAIEYYLEKEEIEKWHDAVKLASEDGKYLSFVDEISNDTGGIYEYKPE